MSFEGSEKRLEIDFSVDQEFPLGLRQICRSQLDQLMDLTRCSIISSSHTSEMDGYVLSESSLFVFKDTFILKTCGRTQILNSVQHLLSITTALKMHPRRVKYTHASFLFPDKQHFPHQRFDTEVAELNKHFSHLSGASYVLGNHSRGLQWHLFYASSGMDIGQNARSIEICVTGLNPVLAKQFVQTESFINPRTTTYKTGISDLLPGAVIDDYMFEPCGYSMNGLSDAGIVTVHVTPEEECSYASVEFACLKLNTIDLDKTVTQVLQIFDPREIHVSMHSMCLKDLVFLKELHASLPGYVSDGMSVQYLSDKSHVAFRAYIQEKENRLESVASLNSFLSYTSPLDEFCLGDCFPPEDVQSTGSSEDRTLSLLTPLLEKKYDIQNIGQTTIESFIGDMIHTKKLQETFYVINLTTVQRLYLNWRRMFPRIEPFYAVKCNPDSVLIRLLGTLGAGFDCASKDEIKLVLELGVPSSKIIFANACKHPSDICAAQSFGVDLTTFDTPSELEKLKRGSPHTRALLRIRADDPNARCLLGNKYGAQMFHLPVLYQKARDLDVRVVGVSFHVGSGATNPDAFSSAIALARSAFDLGLQYGFDMSILDIGGGFCSGKVDEGMTEFEPVQQAVNAALDHYFPVESGIKIIAEPGRYFAETCATLACYIIGARERTTQNGMPLRDYWITDGLYGSFNCILYDHTTPRALPLKDKDETDCYYPSTVFGPTCDGLDMILQDYMLPELNPGDWLLFPDMGAYTLAGASNFNGMNAADVKVFYVWSDCEGTV